MPVTVSREMVLNLTAMVRSVYSDALVAQSNVYQQIATLVPSTLAVETYAWLSELPTMREFKDERVVRELSEYGYTITNKKWEATIGVEREVLEDEQMGQVRLRVTQLAEAAAAHFDQLLFALIALASTTHAYDGVNFYSTTHVVGGNNVSNTGTGALTADNLIAAMTGMRRIPLENGEPMDVRPTHLLVPPELEFTAKQILNSAYYPELQTVAGKPGSFSENPLQGSLIPVVSARIASATEWHVLDCSHAVKPFVIQQRIAPEVTAMDGSDGQTDGTFMRDEYLYGVRSRDNAGLGLWQYAYKSTGGG